VTFWCSAVAKILRRVSGCDAVCMVGALEFKQGENDLDGRLGGVSDVSS
jgi:hypothetical protein